MATKKDRRSDSQPTDDDRRVGRDRRQWERVLVDLEVDYRGEDTFLFAYITDISAMGIFVRTNSPEPPGTRLNLRFSPPGMKPVECEGTVIWINPYRPGDRENLNPGMGIKFTDLTYDQREQIKELVRTFAYLSGDDDESAEGDDEEMSADGADGEEEGDTTEELPLPDPGPGRTRPKA
jgi:type IV pilus assembly protein PilZ